MFFKFNKYAIIETLWTLISLVCDILIICHWKDNLFNWHYFVLIVCIALTCFGVYRSYVSWKTFKIRRDDYYHAYQIFKKYGVKKSILYEFQTEPCGQEVAYQLMKDFDVKDVQEIND